MRKLYLVTATLTVLTALCAVGSSSACIWCDSDKPITMLTYIKEQARYSAEKSALLAQAQPTGNMVRTVPTFLAQPYSFTGEPVDRFYTEYLCKYFPKADTITDLIMPTMCPDALRTALQSYVYFVSSGNWRYFVNSPQELLFEQTHVTILLNQLKLIVDALQRAYLDHTTGLIAFTEPTVQASPQQSILSYWRRQGRQEVYDVYALYLDTIIRLLYINVLFQDYRLSYLYYDKLQRNLKLVAGSGYEQTYGQAGCLYAQLSKMLRQRIWGVSSGGKTVVPAQSTALEEWALRSAGMNELESFINSFTAHYECNVTGKFTHEYHPFLLDKTGKSLIELEQRLPQEEMPIIGRLMLMGYEEQGVPRYYTNYSDAYFTDEMASKTQAGWSLKMFNRFGLLTGYLCKHANKMAEYGRKHKNVELPLTHINPDLVEIFEGHGTLFQEHAFGDAYYPVMNALPRVEHHLVRMAMPELCRELMHFWQTLYNNELKVSGKQHVVGTQDILFSIAYMRHLQKSTTPILHFYMGPDITYPIETSSLHDKEVTRHAQSFVKKFMPQLKAHDGKKTAYIFCSFVDGVGKSTMLGNVQNWMQHGDDVEKYEHVDNSSSQLATVFDYSKDVIIADLPAQVSHFTYKPDGQVYVDIGALHLSDDVTNELINYVVMNQNKLYNDYHKLMRDAFSQLRKSGYDLTTFENINPELSFAANLILLRKQDSNQWISFTYKGNYYLFDAASPRTIRQRVPLATAPSHGLKNTCTEQMIFSYGVRFPLSYQNFTQDLIDQLKEHGAEQVVMVDFMSMYSRSSRENIRVNYIIQQLALLYSDFSVNTSFYQEFVHNAQLLNTFEDPESLKAFHRTLSYEVWVRTALYDVLRENADDSIDALPLEQVTGLLRDKLKALPAKIQALVPRLVDRKLHSEHKSLKDAYGDSREFVSVQQFRATDLIAFSKKLTSLFTKKIVHEKLNALWGKLRDANTVQSKTLYHDAVNDTDYATLDNGLKVQVIGRMSANCRDREILTPIIRQVRANWYALLANLLYVRPLADGRHFELDEVFNVLPVVALYDTNGDICIVRPQVEPVDKEYDMPEYSLFEIQPREDVTNWGVFEDKLYLTDWRDVVHVHGGVYSFGHEVRTSEKREDEDMYRSRPIVSVLYTNFAKEFGDERVLVHEKLFEALTEKIGAIRMNRENWKKEAASNGLCPEKVIPPRRPEKDRWGVVKQDTQVKVYSLRDDQVEGARLYLRAVATLDMILKDPEVDLASRRGEQKDFVANLRITEWITLPWLYGLLPQGPLFDNYDNVEPLLKWDFFSDTF